MNLLQQTLNRRWIHRLLVAARHEAGAALPETVALTAVVGLLLLALLAVFDQTGKFQIMARINAAMQSMSGTWATSRL